MPWFNSISNRLKNKSYNVDEAPIDPSTLKVKRAGIVFVSGGVGGSSRGEFESAPIDFDKIQEAYETDGYVRQALDKYVYLMFKEGYQITGKNKNAIDYIKARLKLMSLSTGQTPKELFMTISSTLVKHANVFVIKARQDIKVPISGLKIQGVSGQKPIAGYFVQNTGTVQIKRNTNGDVLSYKIVANNEEKTIKVTDMIHVYYDKEPGRAFAVPFVWEVLDDVKLLRQLEDTCANMVHKEVYPLRTCQVGDNTDGKQASDDEIEKAKNMIETMNEDGWAIFGEQYKLGILGSEGEALDAVQYLRYYEQRVFSGLGVSEVMMGRGEGASRSTADNQVDQMYDRVEGLQSVVEDYISEMMFLELLLEGGFDPISNPDDMVYFDFNPVDQNRKIAKELHEMLKYQGNMQSLYESRENCGMDPEVDLSGFYYQLINGNEASGSEQSSSANSSADNKVRPANQYTKKNAPTRSANTKESYYDYFSDAYISLSKDLSDALSRHLNNNDNDEYAREVNMLVELFVGLVESYSNNVLSSELVNGITGALRDLNTVSNPGVKYDQALVPLKEMRNNDLSRFKRDLLAGAMSATSIQKLNAFLDSIAYRIKFITKNESAKAYNYGYALCGKSLGKEYAIIDSQCETCKAKYPDKIMLNDEELFRIIPPSLHVNCNCKLKFEGGISK